jgi:hypothetical protein
MIFPPIWVVGYGMVAFGYAIFDDEEVCSKVNSQYQLLFFSSAIDFVSLCPHPKK